MHVRHQHGHLRSVERKAGPPVWEFLWRETGQSGNRVRCNVVIGTLEEYPTEELAQAAINGLRTCINEDRNRQPQQPVFVSDLIRSLSGNGTVRTNRLAFTFHANCLSCISKSVDKTTLGFDQHS